MDEKELVEKYISARTKVEATKLILGESNRILEECESKILEYLEAQGKKDTGMFPGLGKITVTVPRVYATCKEENKETCFAYLKQMERGDLIKETVNSMSLSSFTKEILESGQEVPDCISYYLKPSIKFTRS